jgi:hypothetical protein
MRSTIRFLAFALGLTGAALAAQAAGTVQVSFVTPDKFTDAGDSRGEQERNLRLLKQHFETLAARHLGDGQKLTIEVLDLDLAGDRRFSRRLKEYVRVLDGRSDWPRIKLRYTWQADGPAPRSGEESVADMSYLQRPNRYTGDETLRHEKRMLDEWFAARFGAAAAK